MKLGFKNWLTQANMIKEYCQPFLKMTDAPLYRGFHFPLSEFVRRARVQTVNKNRGPRDSKFFSHKLVDDWFDKTYHIRPRSQAVFCTGDAKRAAGYGEVCYLFPIGNFEFIWGVEKKNRAPVKDTLWLTRQIEDAMHTRKAERAEETTNEVMQMVDWSFSNLEDAQDSGAEICIMCDEVILVPVRRAPNYQKFIQEL